MSTFYVSPTNDNEKLLLEGVAKQINLVYKHRTNIPEPALLEKNDEEFRAALEASNASPSLKLIHSLHKIMRAGTENHTYRDGNGTVLGKPETNWTKIAESLTTEINNFAPPKKPKSSGMSLSADHFYMASKSIDDATTNLQKLSRHYAKNVQSVLKADQIASPESNKPKV